MRERNVPFEAHDFRHLLTPPIVFTYPAGHYLSPRHPSPQAQ